MLVDDWNGQIMLRRYSADIMASLDVISTACGQTYLTISMKAIRAADKLCSWEITVTRRIIPHQQNNQKVFDLNARDAIMNLVIIRWYATFSKACEFNASKRKLKIIQGALRVIVSW